MAKESGLGDNLYVAGYDVSGDTGSVDTISSPIAIGQITAIDKLAIERIHLLRDGSIKFKSYFNPSAGQEHDCFSTLPTADVLVTYNHGTSLGNISAAMTAKQVDYPLTRSDKGELSFDIEAVANGYGLEWGIQLTPGKLIQSGAGVTTAIDFSGATSYGLQAYLHVFDMDGTDAVVAVQDSADGSTGWADVTGGVFTSVALAAVPTAERIQSGRTQTVRRWLRVNVTTAGTLTDITYAVMVVKNAYSISF
jgi:hypothetical protein